MGIKNIIFIHVPKTAGVAIGHGFARDGHLKDGFRNSHSTAWERKKQKNLKWDEDTIVLGVVRNPYDRLWSVYEFYSKKLRSISREVVEKVFRKDLDTFKYSYDDYVVQAGI